MITCNRKTFTKIQREAVKVFEEVFSKKRVYAYKELPDFIGYSYTSNPDNIIVVVKFKDFEIELVEGEDPEDADEYYEDELEEYKRDNQFFTGDSHLIQGFIGVFVINKTGHLEGEYFTRGILTDLEIQACYIHSHLPRLAYNSYRAAKFGISEKREVEDVNLLQINSFCFGNIDYTTEKYSEVVRDNEKNTLGISLPEAYEFYLERLMDLIQVESSIGGPYVSILSIPSSLNMNRILLSNPINNASRREFTNPLCNNLLKSNFLKVINHIRVSILKNKEATAYLQEYLETGILKTGLYSHIVDTYFSSIIAPLTSGIDFKKVIYYTKEDNLFINSNYSIESVLKNSLYVPAYFNGELIKCEIKTTSNEEIETKQGLTISVVYYILDIIRTLLVTNINTNNHVTLFI